MHIDTLPRWIVRAECRLDPNATLRRRSPGAPTNASIAINAWSMAGIREPRSMRRQPLGTSWIVNDGRAPPHYTVQHGTNHAYSRLYTEEA
ncbi:MAG: hypothetical protein NVSMB52_18940 [Chloroflexota bacterium]